MDAKREREITNIFDIGLLLKAAGGAVEIGASFIVAFVPRTLIVHIADLATAGELSGDPEDLIASQLRSLAHTYAVHAHYILASFLFLDGALKILLVVLVFKGYRFAFPLFIAGIALLASYEAYRATATNNLLLGAIVLLDIVLIFLAAHEWRVREQVRAV